MEALRLRVQDIDLAMKTITVRSEKEAKDRVTTLPLSVAPLLQNHLARVKAIHQRDCAQGFGDVYLPYALARKYPMASKKWGWQIVFPAASLSIDPLDGVTRRHHLDPSIVNKAIKARNTQKITAHTFTHSFAARLLQRGTDIRTIQALLGDSYVATTMIYTHVLQQGAQGVPSLLNELGL